VKCQISKLSTENDELKKSLKTCIDTGAVRDNDYYTHFDELLNVVSNNFLKLDGDCRISVYKYDHEGAFILLGRLAERPEWKKKRKSIYSANEGIIKRAWESPARCTQIYNIPDPIHSLSKYVERQKKYAIPEERSQAFTMKSRCYVAYSLKDSGEKTAIIVFESVKPKMSDAVIYTIKQRLRRGRGLSELIVSHVRRYSNIEPSLDDTNQREF